MKVVGSHTQNAALSSAVTIAVPATATHVLLQATSQNVRVTVDGTAPTGTKGFLVAAGAAYVKLPVASNGSLKAIEAAASATLDYQFIAGD
jgi:hypothetical protein